MEIRYIDTHTHLYLEAFKDDIEEVIERAVSNGVQQMFLPNIDSSTTEAMLRLCEAHPGRLFPMIGLHPTSVKENYEDELKEVEEKLDDERFIAIGEIGMDLYWDKTFIKEQQAAFQQQLRWAKLHGLPVVIHARDSFEEIFEVMDREYSEGLTGVFHSFTGTPQQVEKINSYDFYIGINGIATFKNAGLEDIVGCIPLNRLLVETDAPYLAPVPYRGKRNESSYVRFVAQKIADIRNMTIEEIASVTSSNALALFQKVT